MYPVTYEADYQRERNRLTTFFRPILAIPWLIVAIAYGIVQSFAVLIAWFAILIVGRFPEGLYNFVGGVLRFQMRVAGWISLQTDEWPSFGLSDDPVYPIRVSFRDRAARQSRVKTLFRLILILPLLVLSIGISPLLRGITIIAWLTIVFRGYQPAAIHNALAFVNSWETRASSYIYLMRDEYPPVGDENPVEIDPSEQDLIDAGQSGQFLPAAPANPQIEDPATPQQQPPPVN